MDWRYEIEVLGRVALALFAGGIIGLERDIAGKQAGLRTHMLVCGVSAFLVGIGDAFLVNYRSAGLSELIRADPFRMMGAVVTGLSFIGAGSIIRSRKEDGVEGLTTAASLLFVSAIGIGIALKQIYLSIGSTVLVLITNRFIVYFEEWIKKKVDKKIH